MRMLLYVLISVMTVATSASPAQAFFSKLFKRHHHQTPTGCASCEAAASCGDGTCGQTATTAGGHPWGQPRRIGLVTFNAMPEGMPSAPPPPPFPQPMNYQPIYIPAAPDLMNPGPYGVIPPFAPFQGMLLAPAGRGNGGNGGNGGPGGMGPGGMGPGGPGGGPGVFGTHPFARSPRDYFMVGD